MNQIGAHPEASDAANNEKRSPTSIVVQVIGIVLALAAGTITIGSHFNTSWRTCEVTRTQHLEETDESDRVERSCRPLDLSDVAPLLLVGLLLAVPGWTELSVGVVGIKRELRKALQKQEDLSQKVELRILVSQIAAPPETEGAASGGVASVDDARGRQLVEEIKSIVSNIRKKTAASGMPSSFARQLSDLEHVVGLIDKHPDSVSMSELERILERAKSLDASS